MDLLIESKLLEYKTHIVDYATIKSILVNLGYVNINDKIANLKHKGILQPLKKGFYIHTSTVNNNIISKEILSNNLLESPSYISLDYALYWHGLIPESVHEITAITTARSKIFNTNIGIFSYKHIQNDIFRIGLTIESSEFGNFMIASKEKAMCDKIYYTNDAELTSKSALTDFIINDLRIDTEEFENFDTSIIAEYYRISKSKKIGIFSKIIHRFLKEKQSK
jgi:predicted transcriptional regulator of viral defense system